MIHVTQVVEYYCDSCADMVPKDQVVAGLVTVQTENPRFEVNIHLTRPDQLPDGMPMHLCPNCAVHIFNVAAFAVRARGAKG